MGGLPHREHAINVAVMKPEDRIESRDRDATHMTVAAANAVVGVVNIFQ